MFSTIESPSRNLASRERIYKNYGVAGPASALSSLSHKLKGGYACLRGWAILNEHRSFQERSFSSLQSFSSHSI